MTFYCEECYKQVGIFHDGVNKDRCSSNSERFGSIQSGSKMNKTPEENIEEKLKRIESKLTNLNNNLKFNPELGIERINLIDKKIEKLELNVTNIIDFLIQTNQVKNASKEAEVVCVSSDSDDEVQRRSTTTLKNKIDSDSISSTSDDDYQPGMIKKPRRKTDKITARKRTIPIQQEKTKYLNGLGLKVRNKLTGPKRALRPRVKLEI